MNLEWLREIWQYRELFYFLVWRDVKVRYKQTVLGAAWAVIQPFFSMVVFTLFFQRLANMPSDGIPYPIFSYSALIPWTYFSTAISTAGNSLVANSNLLTKVYFPRVAVPASSAFGGIVDFSIASVVLLAIMAYYRFSPQWSLLLWPVLVVPLVVLALGVGMFMAALNVRYRDIRYALPFFVQIWLFVTPIIYPTSIIPEKFRVLMFLNPLAGIIEGFRACVFPQREINWALLSVSIVTTVVIFIVGALYFRKTERTFADIV
ncbi:MAG TPA: ABC transporter permease [Planctomycetota bacterium]|nr:ABC transporter permease [Planctomycetota bacterium]